MISYASHGIAFSTTAVHCTGIRSNIYILGTLEMSMVGSVCADQESRIFIYWAGFPRINERSIWDIICFCKYIFPEHKVFN